MNRPAASKIDRSKLREAIRQLGDEYVFYLLDEALDLVPDAKLAKLVGKYLDLNGLHLDAGPRPDLFGELENFKTRSRPRPSTEPTSSRSPESSALGTASTPASFTSPRSSTRTRCRDRPRTPA